MPTRVSSHGLSGAMPTMTSSPPVSGAAAALRGAGSSALVLEYICLFTHDLRRKQKRWQDGRLRFHTFNKRVMVYDERGNTVGDTHWRADWDLDSGEEFKLERGSAVVQVSDCIGRETQDLSELLDKRLDKRLREKEQRHTGAASRPPAEPSLTRRHDPLSQLAEDNAQLRHRPLRNLIGTPTGHYGRASVPATSPFERRHGEDHAPDAPDARHDARSPKRRKRDRTTPEKTGYAQSLFGATLNLSAAPVSSAPSRRPGTDRQRCLQSTSSAPNSDAHASHTSSTPRHSEITVRGRRGSPSIEGVPAGQQVPTMKSMSAGGSDPEHCSNKHKDGSLEQKGVSPPVNRYPLSEMLNLTSCDGRSMPSMAAEDPEPTVGRPVPSGGKTERPPERPEPASRLRPPPAAARLPADVIEIDDEGAPPRLGVRDGHVREDGPKTELRLKPGKRRGLLLISEPTFSGDRRQGSVSPERKGPRQQRDESGQRAGPRINEKPVKEITGFLDMTAAMRTAAATGTARRPSGVPDSDKSDKDLPEAEMPRILLRRAREAHSNHAESGATSETADNSNGEEAVGGCTVKRAKRVRSEDRGPRLVKLGRRSVKSKELVGFVSKEVDADCRPRATSPARDVHPGAQQTAGSETSAGQSRTASTSDSPTAAAVSRQSAVEKTGWSHQWRDFEESQADKAHQPSVAGVHGSPAVVVPEQSDRPRNLVNPATRGRKAALRSDAAGQVPQPPLPLDVGAELSRTPAPAAAVAAAAAGDAEEANGNGSEPTKRKMKFPGFVSARGGGPWSREAHDLLATGRPGRGS